MTDNNLVNVLWTGGWDSTYRVLDLVLVQNVEVQPHYIIDVERLSTRHEIQAISRIREGLSLLSPEAARRLRPTAITSIGEIAPNQGITDQYRRLRSQFELGPQYEWLNRYAAGSDLIGLEIGFQQEDDDSHFDSLRSHVSPTEPLKGLKSWKLQPGHGDPRISMFERFTFPLLFLSKGEMRESAIEKGFLELLELSWFCHYPIHDTPCGCCNVCRHAIKTGVSYKFTKMGRLRNRFWMIFHPVRLLLIRPHIVKKGIQERLHWRFGNAS